MARQNIYDNDAFFENYCDIRSRSVNFNDSIETPILFSLLPSLRGCTVLDIGCGMGQHARQYAAQGAARVLGIDLSEKMLAYARTHSSAANITYRRLAFEELGALEPPFDVVTSSLAFDYAEDLDALFADVARLLRGGGHFVFSLSHPMVTAWDGSCDRFTRTDSGERLYANVPNYLLEGKRTVKRVVENYELYHHTFASIVNALVKAGFLIERCEESRAPDELLQRFPAQFGGTVHRPDFLFFRCKKPTE